VAHGIEKMDHGDDVERILDGISRLCDQRPDDFQRQADPIIHRIKKTLNAENPTAGLLTPYCDRGVVRVLMAWLAGNARGAKFSSVLGDSPTWRTFMVQRLRALSDQVEKCFAGPLLAAPTYRGGWIDPVVWADRFLTLVETDVAIHWRELAQSFLRLTPDGRAEALTKLEQVESPYRDAVVWALGGESQVKASDQAPGLWIAASRCRDPEIRLKGVWKGEFTEGPDVLEPAEYRWKSTRGVRNYATGGISASKDEGTEPMIAFDMRPGFARSGAADVLTGLLKFSFSGLKQAARAGELRPEVTRYPTALSHLLEPGFHPKWVIHWSAMVWPGKSTGYWACAVNALLRRINMKPSTLEPHSAYLDPLFEFDRPLIELSALALWIASLSKDSDSRTAAIDAWTELIADGRGDAKLLGDVLIRIRQGGWLQLNRLADSLRDVSRISPLHAWTVTEILQDLLESMNELPRDAHHILQLLRELLIQLGLEVRGELKPLLAPIKGSSKTAKLTRELSQLTDSAQPTQRRAGLLHLVDARLERAKRWADHRDR
jgi:hypothetical protein